MENKVINIGVVRKIAIALKDLRLKVAFVGGAVISLYTDDPAADELRPTKDVDLSITLESYGAWATLQEELAKLGFNLDTTAPVLCRFRYDDITVDIMPDDEKVLGFSNPWYRPGLQSLQRHALPGGPDIYLFTLPYFLATKFSAFLGRGKGDYRGSHDFEDIIYVTDHATQIISTIEQADPAVKKFLVAQYQQVWGNPYRNEIISCHLSPILATERFPIVEGKLKAIIALG